MESMLAEAMKRIGFSPTLKISAKAKAMQAEGIDVVDLSVGEPDFPTPKNIREAAKRAIDTEKIGYTASEGMLALRRAIARKLKEENRLEYDAGTEIIVSSGAKNSLYHLFRAILNPGEEVIIPAPYWVSYPEMVKLSSGVPVIVQTKEENGFRLTPDELKSVVSANTKAVILCNPANPTGSGYDREKLREIATAAVEEGLLIVADEIYEKLLYDGMEFVSVAALSPRIKAHTVVVNGVSKAYAMTGWRIGYSAGPPEIIGAMGRVQSHALSNVNTVSQYAAIEALTGPQHDIDRMREEFVRRRNYMYDRLKTLPHVSCHRAEGAFYLFPNVSHYYSMECEGVQIRNSYGMAYHLLRNGHVAIVPGDAFGADRYIRLSYATSMERIRVAMDRISEALAMLRPSRALKKRDLANTVTKVKAPVELDPRLSVPARDAMVAEADAFLSKDGYFEWNANIAGNVIQLRTNSPHLYDFFVENFYPSPLESDIEPHGILYGVNWIPGREAKAYYNSETRTGFLYKSAYYGQLRSLALGLVTDLAERVHDVQAVRGVCLDVGGRGVLILAPSGTGKSGHMAELLARADTKLVSPEFVFVRHQGGRAIADTPERKFYVPTDLAGKMPALASHFDKSKCENVVTRREDCAVPTCPDGNTCPLERGEPYCYLASRESRAMLDPYWLDGPAKHAKRTTIHHVILLVKDSIAKPVKQLDAAEALRFVEEGRDDRGRSVPFLNPHLLIRGGDRQDLHRRQWRRLFESAPVHQLNVGRMTSKEARKSTRDILGL